MELEIPLYFDVCDAKDGGKALLTFEGREDANYESSGWAAAGGAGIRSVELRRGRRAIAHRFQGPPLTYRLPDGKRLLTEDDQELLLPAFVPWAKASTSYWTGHDYSCEISVPEERQDEVFEEMTGTWTNLVRLLHTLGLRELSPSLLALPSRRQFIRLPWFTALLWFWLSHDGHRGENGEERAPLAMRGGRLGRLRRTFPGTHDGKPSEQDTQ